MAIGDWLGSLFGGTPTYTPQPGGTDTPPGTLAGLLDPRGIREQAAWSGLGALSQGLLAAGMRRPAGSPSPLPQAFGAFGPAYQGALQSGYQTAAAEQQMRKRQEDEQRLEAYRQANPAARNLPDAVVIAQLSRAPPEGFTLGANQTRYDAQGRPIASVGPAPQDDIIMVDGRPYSRRLLLGDSAGGPPGTAAPPAPGTAPTQPGATPPPGAPPGQAQLPLGLRHNNPLNLGGERDIQAGRFTYATPEEGVAAAVRQINLNQARATQAGRPLTPLSLVQGWATTASPADQQSYAREIALATNTPIDQPINLGDPAVLARAVAAMARREQGTLPGGYSEVISRGITAGLQPGEIRPGGSHYAPGQIAPLPRSAQAAQAPQGGRPAAPAAAPPAAAPAPAVPAPAAPGTPPAATAPPLETILGAPVPTVLPQPHGDLVLRQPRGALISGPTDNQITQARNFSSHFISQPEVRNALRVTTVLASMEEAATQSTAASDLNLVYGLMTILDPGSVVRDSETGMVRATQSADAQLVGLANRLISGQTSLGAEGRRALMEQARSRARAQIGTYNTLYDREAPLIQEANLNPNRVLGPRLTLPQPARAPEPAAPPPPATSVTTPTVPGAPAPRRDAVPVATPPRAATAAVPPRPISAEPTPQEMQMLSIGDLTGHADNWDALTPAQQRAVRTETRRRAGIAP